MKINQISQAVQLFGVLIALNLPSTAKSSDPKGAVSLRVAVSDPALISAIENLEVALQSTASNPNEIYRLSTVMVHEARYLKKAYPDSWGAIVPYVKKSLDNASDHIPSNTWKSRQFAQFQEEMTLISKSRSR